MGMMSKAKMIRLLNAKEMPLFNLDELGNLFKIKNRQTLYKRVQRLEQEKIIKQLMKGKYWFRLKPVDDYTLANFLRYPSYVSLESALSFYSIMTGFSYQVTSITVRKPTELEADQKEFIYSQISQKLFWGWEKKENFLIAKPEKALLDYVYLAQKGLRNLDWEEIDMSGLDQKLFFSWAKKYKIKI